MPTPPPKYAATGGIPLASAPRLDGLFGKLDNTSPYEPYGQIERVVGLTIECSGLKARLNDICELETGLEGVPPLKAEVVGFKEGRLLLMPLGELLPLAPGSKVRNVGHPFRIPVGPEMLGRILDPLGQPLDNRYKLSEQTFYRTQARAPHPLQRQDIRSVVPLGLRCIDAFTTLGEGQRVGIFAGSGVGKSTLLGMMARNTEADVSVIALIGERGREVKEFIDQALGKEGLQRSVVIVATAEQPALLKLKAAMVATTVAEYFREQGNRVLLMMDSLTRVAMAQREIGLAVGEPPATRGYTPSVYALLPQLLERAGNSDKGSITGLYTVLVEGDDFNEPISDMARGLLDGHILLKRELAEQGHFPAIDMLGSLSRVMPQITNDEHRAAAVKVRETLALYKQSEDLISIGAYVPGSNPALDRAVKAFPLIQQFLRQQVNEPSSWNQTLEGLLSLARQMG